MVFFNPAVKSVLEANPNSFKALLVSSIRLGCPSGFDLSHNIFPEKLNLYKWNTYDSKIANDDESQ